jgi:signal transduction histidine kinase
MNPLRSVGGRLALALLVVVAAALAIVYWTVVPSYERSLENNELRTLSASMTTAVNDFADVQPFELQLYVEGEAPKVNARVVVYVVQAPVPLLLSVAADSNLTSSTDVAVDPTVLRAAQRQSIARGVVSRGGEKYAEVAYPLSANGVVILLSTSLHDQLQTVGVVRKRVFEAGAVAIVLAALLGYVLASLFARRIRRLEHAAERIAGGSFDEPVVDAGSDELGQLARAFERMRLRLAYLDRARGEFIANASHELRTPLFSLGGFLELLDDEELSPEERTEFLASMREQVTRLTKLATDLLDLSRMDAGRLGMASESLDLAQLGDELATEFRPRAVASDHVLEAAVDDPVLVRGDAERVLQIGRILVENALVHTPPGTTVRVSAAVDGRRATLTVADDGPGIPREAQTQVFDRFYRLDGTVASAAASASRSRGSWPS